MIKTIKGPFGIEIVLNDKMPEDGALLVAPGAEGEEPSTVAITGIADGRGRPTRGGA